MYSRWHVCNGIPFSDTFDNFSVICDTMTFSDMWYHDLQWHLIPLPSVTCDTMTFSDMWYLDLQWHVIPWPSVTCDTLTFSDSLSCLVFTVCTHLMHFVSFVYRFKISWIKILLPFGKAYSQINGRKWQLMLSFIILTMLL